jgi:hypothetical protein
MRHSPHWIDLFWLWRFQKTQVDKLMGGGNIPHVKFMPGVNPPIPLCMKPCPCYYPCLPSPTWKKGCFFCFRCIWPPLRLNDSDFGQNWKPTTGRFPYFFRMITRFFLGAWIFDKPVKLHWWTREMLSGTTRTQSQTLVLTMHMTTCLHTKTFFS